MTGSLLSLLVFNKEVKLLKSCYEKKKKARIFRTIFPLMQLKNVRDLKKENLAFSGLIWWSNHIGNLREGRNGTAGWFYFDICPSNMHGGSDGCYTYLHDWPEQLQERQSSKPSKLFLPLKSSIFRIKVLCSQISRKLSILETLLVPLGEHK